MDTLSCNNCGGQVQVGDERCSHCGAMNYIGAKAKYFRDLDDIKENLGDLDQIPMKDYKQEMAIQWKKIIKVSGICLIILALVWGGKITYGKWQDGKYRARYADPKEQLLWDRENFPKLDQWYEAQEYEKILAYEDELYQERKRFTYDNWQHNDFFWAYKRYVDGMSLLEKMEKSEAYTEDDLSYALYAALIIEMNLEKEGLDDEEMVRARVFQVDMQSLLYNYLKLDKEEALRLYKDVSPRGFVEYKLVKICARYNEGAVGGIAMKCIYCGSNLSIDDELCGFCGKENIHATQHRKDMADFKGDYDYTKTTMYQRSSETVGMIVKGTIIGTLIVCCFLFLFATFNRYEISGWMEKRKINKDASIHIERLEGFEAEGDYFNLGSYYLGQSLYRLDKAREYGAIADLSNGYYTIYNDTFAYLNYKESNETYRTKEDFKNSISSAVADFYDRLEFNEYWPEEYTEKRMMAMEDLRYEVETFLQVYLKVSKEDIETLPELSRGQCQTIIERSMENIEE